MTLRSEARAAVREVQTDPETASMWINITVNATSNQAYDPTNPSVDNPETPDTVLALEHSYSIFESGTIEGVQSGDRRFYVHPDDLPNISIIDSVQISGVEYEVVEIMPIQQDVLLEIQLRKNG